MIFDKPTVVGRTPEGQPACEEHYYPEWSSRGMRVVICGRPAKVEAWTRPYSEEPAWAPKCGIHARLYKQTRPLGSHLGSREA